MKIKFDIDCTPEEARAFLGLPDVQPMQKAVMEEVTQRVKQAMAAMDPETILKTWLPASIESWEHLQKAFWGQIDPDKWSGGTEPPRK
ncbi:MAG TPA: DUF6489 family protein [Alphaproteobacteria bacterium]